MKLFLIVPNQAILDEIGVTPDLEGGVGPVKLGVPIQSKDGRLAVCHNWAMATKNWFESYLSGVAGYLVVEELPADFELEDTESEQAPL